MSVREWGTTKPPAGLPLDWQQPLSRGLLLYATANEGGGPRIANLARPGHSGTLSGTTWGMTRSGPAVAHTATSDAVSFGTDDWTPTGDCTVVLGLRKRDATNRASGAFGASPCPSTASRIGAHLPYSDGTVYFDYGGSSEGTTRLSVGGLTFGHDLWCFTVGPRGMEIWQNGVRRAANAATPTRVRAGNPWYLNNHDNAGGDLADDWLVAMYDRQLTESECATYPARPYSPVWCPRRFWMVAPPAGGATLTITPSGTLTTAGALVKQIGKVHAGTLTTAGALVKSRTRAFAGTLSTAGALAKQIGKPFAGPLTTAGALTPIKNKVVAVAGTLATAGAIVRQIGKVPAGTLTAAGAIVRSVARSVAGALTTSGGLSVAVPGDLPFRDDFTTGFDPLWDENDASGVLSVLNGRAFFEYDDTQDDWLDPALVSPAANRADMAGLVALVRLTNRMDGAKGFKLSLSPSAADPDAADSGQINVLYPDLFVPDMDESASLARQRSKDLLLAVVPRAGGGWFTLVSEGKAGGEWPVFPAARIIGASWTENPATVYAHLAARRGRVHVDYAAVLAASSLPAALTTRLGAALASESSGTRTAGTSSITNAGTAPRIIEAILTRGANNDTRAVICFRGSSTAYANCWKFKGEFDRFTLHNTSGVQTQSGAATMPSGTPTHLRVVDHGDLIECYVNGVRRLDWNSTTGAGNTYAGTACDTGASLSVTVTDFAAWDTVTLTDDFGPFPKVPDAVGSAIISDAFTGTNGTPLPTYDAAWANSVGTVEINSNRARISTSATNGIATKETGTVNHAAQVVVGLPADPGTYPIDVFAGPVIRWTDSSNFIQARLLWQDGPSPEVEVWEYVAGAGNLIAYTNVTGTVVSAGDFTLKVAARGAEVAAYLNGECVAQGTTALLTGTRVGFGVFDTNPGGQPTFDDFAAYATNPSISLGGTLSMAGALVKRTGRALAGTLTSSGALSKQRTRALSGTLTTAGGLSVTSGAALIPVALLGTLTTTGAVVRRISKVIQGTLSAAGSLTKRTSKAPGGTAGFAGTLAVGKVKLVSRAGTAGFSGSVISVPLRNLGLGGTLGLDGDLIDLTVILTPPPLPPEAVIAAETAAPEFGALSETAPPGSPLSKVLPPEFGLRG